MDELEFVGKGFYAVKSNPRASNFGRSIPQNKPHILIVDDEQDITAALKLGLERAGFSIDVSNDPRTALGQFESLKYDIAILDIRMPGLNGFQLYRELKKKDDQVSFCFLTAFDVYRNEFEKVFPDISVKTFLRKPVTLAQLVPRLKDIMNQRFPVLDGKEERQP